MTSEDRGLAEERGTDLVLTAGEEENEEDLVLAQEGQQILFLSNRRILFLQKGDVNLALAEEARRNFWDAVHRVPRTVSFGACLHRVPRLLGPACTAYRVFRGLPAPRTVSFRTCLHLVPRL